jgi:hypothetical protein
MPLRRETPFGLRPTMPQLAPVQFAFMVALLLAATVSVSQAQKQPPEPPAAPVPSQIVNARKVFIANAAGDHDPRVSKYFGGPDGIYNQFYADIRVAEDLSRLRPRPTQTSLSKSRSAHFHWWQGTPDFDCPSSILKPTSCYGQLPSR